MKVSLVIRRAAKLDVGGMDRGSVYILAWHGVWGGIFLPFSRTASRLTDDRTSISRNDKEYPLKLNTHIHSHLRACGERGARELQIKPRYTPDESSTSSSVIDFVIQHPHRASPRTPPNPKKMYLYLPRT